MSRALALACVLAIAPGVAHADKATAMALFDEGLKELKAGNTEKACVLLAQSNEAFADSGTRGTLARCYTQLGRVVSAWRLWRELADTAPKELRADAAANAAKLEPRLPKYLVHVTLANGPRVEVTLDGEVIDPAIDVPTPIDPGKHTVEATAEGFTSWKRTFDAVEGKTADLTIPALAPVVTDRPPPLPVVPRDRGRGRRRLGLGLTVGGGAVAVTGVVFGVIARGRYADARSLCGGDIDRCEAASLGAAQDKVDSARNAGNLSTVFVLAGGAIAVAGVVLYVTAPKRERPQLSIAPTVTSDTAGFVLAGGF